MHKDLLLEIINNGIDELKQICHSFNKNEFNDTEIDIAIYKTKTLLKEFVLLKDSSFPSVDSDIKEEERPLDDNIAGKTRNISTDKTSERIDSQNNNTNNSNNIAKDIKEESGHTLEFNPESEIKEKIIGETISATADINKLININDKFQFSRELFDNDINLYNETINKLNNATGFENAKKIISSFAWNEEDDTVAHFMEILTRKFNYNV